VRVLDARLRPVPAGVTGEVWVAGEGLARGYAGHPGLTAERFLPDPHGEPGTRMYRTGDLGRLRPDGALECLGRADHQVKVRGFRVEPGEVEAVLRQHPAVGAAVVAAREDRPGDRRLVAYVVAANGAPPRPSELREWVAARLPAYMVPSVFARLDALPLTPNGKTDRLRLPAPEGMAEEDGAAFVEPRTPTERRLAAICAEVLGVDRVGAADDFFALGGHSLRATQVTARVRESFGVELRLPELFAHPTVEGLAARVDAALEQRRAAPSRIPRAPRDRPLPLSASQEAIWFFQALAPGMRAYAFQGAVRFTGALDVAALEGALNEIVRRHEIFRTVFVPGPGGDPVQEIRSPWRVVLPVRDLSPAPEEEREALLERRMAEEFARPFDPAVLPLVRWSLFRLRADEHVLAVAEHHFVHDGWSFGVFLRELREIYLAFSRGEPSPLPEPAIQFADYAAWQQAWLEGPEAGARLAYWKGKMTPVPPVLDLPCDRPRPLALSFTGGSRRVRLDPVLAAEAARFSTRSGTTLYMTLLAAFEAMVARLSGQTSFCVGGGVAEREMRETEELIGMLVNTVPLRADLSGDPPFRELLVRVRETALEAYAHPGIPFGRIVDAVHPERSLGHLPLYQVAFNFHHAPYPDPELPGLRMTVREALPNGSAKFDLQVIVIPRGQQGAGRTDEVEMIWEYSADLFDPHTVDRMIAHYETLLGAALQDPAARLSDLPLLSREEGLRLLAEWNDTGRDFPRDRTLAELFEEQVDRAPNHPAVVYGAELLTYGELDMRANRLARHLRERGAGPEARVGVCLERSPDLVVAIMAALKAGAAYVPLDPSYPRDRIAYMVEDGGISVLVTDQAHDELLPGGGIPVVRVDADAQAIAAEPDARLPRRAVAEGMAYVVYTSGSTGKPKGVAIPHRGLARTVCGTDYVEIRPGDRLTQVSNASFDAFSFELWGALLNGATLVGVPREVSLSPQGMAEFIRTRGVTTVFLTTALFNQVAREVPDAFRGVRYVLFGGEASDPAAVRRVLEAGGPDHLLHMYGPSESTTYASWHEVRDVPAGATTVPIGLPVANTTLYVLDAQMRPVPLGVEGELYVGGAGLALGYLGRPAMTADRFVPDPFAASGGERLYRTGDRVRRLRDGALEFLGRVDRQVKVRGFRIEPGEIEAVLSEHPRVGECVVSTHQDETGVKDLVGYVVPAPGGGEPAPEVLRAFLADRLPAHMVPAAFVMLESFPLTPNGKTDYDRLPAPSSFRAGSSVPYVPPRNALEETLAAIWCEILGVERVGIDDDFFELGGHSLRATRVATRAREALRVEVPVRDLFDHPTLRTLGPRVEEMMGSLAVDDQDLLAHLEALEGLSDDEVLRLLGETQP
jgi:amino acid adenylation domain-containing protein